MSVIISCAFAQAPDWVLTWLEQHPQWPEYQRRFSALVAAGLATTDQVCECIQSTAESVGLDVFDIRDQEVWVTIRSRDLHTGPHRH